MEAIIKADSKTVKIEGAYIEGNIQREDEILLHFDASPGAWKNKVSVYAGSATV